MIKLSVYVPYQICTQTQPHKLGRHLNDPSRIEVQSTSNIQLKTRIRAYSKQHASDFRLNHLAFILTHKIFIA